MSWPDFLVAYGEIIEASCSLLKPNRFACFVVSDFRDKDGNYVGFPYETTQAFRRAGLNFYNDAVLLNAIGSLPVRTSRQFMASRKMEEFMHRVSDTCSLVGAEYYVATGTPVPGAEPKKD